MIFSLLILVLVAAIAFFHYTQGFFSATLSAVISIFAAVLAIGYHENVVALLVTGPAKYADYAHGMVLVALFALIYIVLRVIFDKMVPGNIRLNPTADKVGAGIMGLVAAVFSTGILAIAAQMLPFGPSIGGYTRSAVTGTRSVVVPASPRAMDVDVHNELASDALLHIQPNTKMILPVDDVVLGMTAHLSHLGSLSGARPLRSVHPDYLKELFGQRLGVQVGAERTALNTEGTQQVEVVGLYEVEGLNQVEGDLKVFRDRTLSPAVRPDAGWHMVVVRVMVKKDAADADNLFRFSPGSARIVADGRNYFPVGTVENGSLLLNNEPDDFLFLDLSSGDRGVDLVFSLPHFDAVKGSDNMGRPALSPGSFFELKRMGRVDLSNKPLERGLRPDPNVGVIRKAVQ